jgi:hypothetical protein
MHAPKITTVQVDDEATAVLTVLDAVASPYCPNRRCASLRVHGRRDTQSLVRRAVTVALEERLFVDRKIPG